MAPMHPLDFLRAIGLTSGLVHLALDDGRVRRAQHFVPATDEAQLRAALDALVARNATGPSSVVFGVNARCRQRGKDEDVPVVTAMVFDFDAQKVGDRDRLNRFLESAPPTVVVRSGSPGNGHLYWVFDAPVAPDTARSLMRRLCKRLGADASWPPSKMMRLPGSRSWKDGQPRPVEVVSHAPAVRTSPDRFAAALDANGFVEPPAPARPARQVRPTSPGAQVMSDIEGIDVADVLARLPPWSQNLVVLGKQEGDRYPSRSEADFAVVARLVEVGATDDEVHAVFAAHPDGIGVRAREQGPDYLTRTIEAARRSLAFVPARIEAVGGKPDRMTLDLLVRAGEQAGLRFTTGVSARSSVWRYVFQHAGVPVAQTLYERSALTGRIVGVSLGMTALGNWEVRRWGTATMDEAE